jgi:hypothetical protein
METAASRPQLKVLYNGSARSTSESGSALSPLLRRNHFSQRRNLNETIECYAVGVQVCGSDMEQGTFERGYIAGWRSLRGPENVPPNLPPSPMRVPASSYVVGSSRALSDATDNCRLESWDARGDGGAISIPTRGPGSLRGLPDLKPRAGKKRIVPHAGHR